MRPGREPLLRDLRERERLLPEGLIQQHERERERERERDARGERGGPGERGGGGGGDRERDRMMMMMMEMAPHGDPRAPGRGEGVMMMMRPERPEYEPLLPREAFSGEGEKPGNSHQPGGGEAAADRADSVDGRPERSPVVQGRG
jgi:hypothetical protein